MILSATGKQELMAWYKKQCQDKAAKMTPSSKIFFRIIKIYLIVYIVSVGLYLLLWLLMFVIATLSGDDIDRLPAFASPVTGTFLNGVLFFSGMAALTYVLARERLARLTIMESKGIITLLAQEKCLSLRNDVYDLGREMSIDISKIIFWKVISTSPFPSIEEDKDGLIHLVIPVNFFVYHKNNRRAAIAVLAHELGHVVQGDTQLYAVTDTYFSIVRSIFVPTICLNIVTIMWMFYKMIGNRYATEWMFIFIVIAGLINLILLMYLLEGAAKIKEARKESEILADTASLLYAGNDGIITVLKEHKIDKKIDLSIHPDNDIRIDHLTEVIHKYQLIFA